MLLKPPEGRNVMEQVNPSGTATNPGSQQNVDEERKKLDADLQSGKITQAEYFKKMQELTGSMPTATPGSTPQPAPGVTPVTPPQLPPAPGAGQGTVSPVTPITPVTPQQAGPKEEIPPVGQALAVSSDDIEVVECYKCGGLITVTTSQRPVIIACPTCGTKGEVDTEEPEPVPKPEMAPKPTAAKELDEDKTFKFAGEETVSGPQFGASLDADLAKQDAVDKQHSTPTPSPTPTPTPAPTPATTPSVTPSTQPKATPSVTPTTTPAPQVNKDKKTQ